VLCEEFAENVNRLGYIFRKFFNDMNAGVFFFVIPENLETVVDVLTRVFQ